MGKSYLAAMVKILTYYMTYANLCKFTSAESSSIFSRFIPIEVGLLELKKNITCQVILVSTNNEHVGLSSDKLSFGVDDTFFSGVSGVYTKQFITSVSVNNC